MLSCIASFFKVKFSISKVFVWMKLKFGSFHFFFFVFISDLICLVLSERFFIETTAARQSQSYAVYAMTASYHIGFCIGSRTPVSIK